MTDLRYICICTQNVHVFECGWFGVSKSAVIVREREGGEGRRVREREREIEGGRRESVV